MSGALIKDELSGDGERRTDRRDSLNELASGRHVGAHVGFLF
jgi:hypothetical protein